MRASESVSMGQGQGKSLPTLYASLMIILKCSLHAFIFDHGTISLSLSPGALLITTSYGVTGC